MSDFFDALFSKKSIFVVLIVFLVAVALVFWDFKVLTYLNGSSDLSGLQIETATEKIAAFAMVGVGALVTGIFSVLVICNVLFWMIPCLFKALFCLIGAIPIVNILFSRELRESWSEAIDEWLTPKTYLTFDPFSLFLVDVVEEEESDGLIMHFIFSSVSAFIKGIIGCIGYIIAAVGIPLSCPLVTILAMGGIIAVTENPVWLAVIGIVCFLIVGFVLIGIPVIALCRKK